MGANYTKSLYKEYELVLSQKEKLEAEYKALRINFQLMHKEIQRLSKAETELRETAARMEREKQELIWENMRLRALTNMDGMNSGLPTSRTFPWVCSYIHPSFPLVSLTRCDMSASFSCLLGLIERMSPYAVGRIFYTTWQKYFHYIMVG